MGSGRLLTFPLGEGQESAMTDGLLAIGAFSRASLVSAKQLRAYHEAGRFADERGVRVPHA